MHFVMRWEYLAEERLRLNRLMIDMADKWNDLGDKEEVVIVMNRVCREGNGEGRSEEAICCIFAVSPPALICVAFL